MGEIRTIDGPKILPRGYGKTLPSPPAQYEWEARPYVFREFPKAMTEPCTQKHIEHWRSLNKYTDPRTQAACYNGHPPKLGSMVGCLATEEDIASGFADALNEEVTVNNPEEEEIFRQMHPQSTISAPIPDVRAGVVAGLQRKPTASTARTSTVDDDIETVAEKNRLLANMLAERKELLRQIAELDAPKPLDTEKLTEGLMSERETLVAQALEKQIPIDKRWGIAKIKAALAADEG